MSDQTNNHSALQKTPVAIIGLAGVFPQAENLQEYWDNIVKEVDSITDVPESRWKIEDYYDPDPTVPDKTYCKRGGFLPDIDFNPMEFGLPPNILEVTDVSQLLSLVVAKQAMKDAGYGDDVEFNRAKTGVVLGVGGGQKLITPLTARLQYPVWDRVLESSGISAEDRAPIIEKMKKAYIHWEENSFPGMLGNVISGRVANRLDLGGMNCVVDAACAASLAAIKMAVTELADYRADTMITGGVDTDNSIFMYMSFSKTPAFSKNNEIRPFDAGSDGMMIGEGVGMLVLKRLEDAQRDGDRIYAVIKGIGTSSDGKYKSIYAPRASGQALAVDRAYQDAGFPAQTVQLVEAHGTGTPAGDPTEFAGLTEVFGHNNPNKQHIALGSVKSQIGHTKAAAGAASLIKTALALYHRVLPPTLNVDQPNPKMEIENSPFYLNTHSRPWLPPQNGNPRRAGVSAFGFGGTNFHFALEEHNGEPTHDYRLHKTPEDIFITAPNPAQLITKCDETLATLKGEGGEPVYRELVIASQTPNIPTESARLGFVSDSLTQAIEFLETAVKLLKSNPSTNWEHPKGIYYRANGIAAKGKIVALFPGQGSQYLEMGKELALNFPPIRDTYGKMDALFVNDGQAPLSDVLFPIPVFSDEEKQVQLDTLRRTEFVQPAIGAFSVGLYKLLQQAGFNPDFAAGHSFGELTALWAGGVIDDATFYYLAKARGQAMAAPGGPSIDTGTMVAVKGNIDQLQQDIQGLDGVTIANYNSNEQVVLAGSKPAMQQAQAFLEPKGYVVTPLTVSAAFHTEFVGHAQQPFAQAIDKAQFNPPRIAIYSNSSAQPYSNRPQDIKTTLQDHILNPVLFRQEIENIYAAGGSVFVEIGPKRVLTNLVKNILGDRPHIALAVNASKSKGSDRQLREAYVQLCVAGLPLRAIDPYSREYSSPTSNKKSPINVNLSGNNYVSPKTQKAYAEALADGHTVSNNQQGAGNSQRATTAQPVKAIAQPVKTVVATAPPPAPKPVVATQPVAPKPIAKPTLPPSAPAKTTAPVASKAAITNGRLSAPVQNPETKGTTQMSQSSPLQERIEKSLGMLHEHQAETARVHETYLKGQETYAQSVVQLVQQYQSGNGGQALKAPVAKAPNVPSNGNGVSNGNGFVAPKPVAPTPTFTPPAPAQPKVTSAPVAPAPTINREQGTGNNQQVLAPPAPASNASVAELAEAMLVVVSEKTGYPVEMLELSMDMESDLGIDSIKRVEILGAMQEQHPELPEVNPNELAELRTLQQIVDHLSSSIAPSANGTATPVAVAPAPVAATEVAQPATAVPTTAPTSNASVAELAEAMLVVVSEKTGYPVEMLELSMDMESDLGIDSIKRVEILGAMQEQHPELPEVNPNELAELRTLQQIVDHLSSSIAPSANGTAAPVAAAPVAESVTAVPEATPTSNASVAVLADAMLVVVSEKTGYPVEMLELSMDMESDLGIDSIKRVEILGAMQEQHPELPEVNPNELAELRTLQQIVDHLSSSIAPSANGSAAPVAVAPVAEPAVPEVAPTSNTNVAELAEAMLVVVSEKTGYPVEMLELSMDMESDLGIDSIKRVEILGAMQEQHPELPEVNPNELAELRTLQQIVDHLSASLSNNQQGTGNNQQSTTAPQSSALATPAPSSNGNASVAELAEAMLVVVSEKTGYPVEMLELSMDMESDLGIDSIKRVEILGAMQEQHPELPEVNPNELAELRTLQEIVDHLGSSLKKADPATAGAGISTASNRVPAPTNHAIIRNVVQLKSLPMPDFLAYSLPETAVCLITDDGTANTTAIAQTLLDRGWNVAVLSLPQAVVPTQAPLPAGVQRVVLADLSEAHLAEQLKQFGNIGSFIHLQPANAEPALKLVFFIAKHLKEALTTAGQQQERASFITVTQLDGALGLDGTTAFDPINGGLFGLTKTVNLEWPQVYCRAIDIHPGFDAEQTAAYILAELHDPNRLVTEVGYGNRGRVTLDTVETPMTPFTPSNEITRDSVFVVSGGAKGITADCVIRLAQQYQCKFALLGRSSIDDIDTSWLSDYADEAALKRQIMERVIAQGEKPTPMVINKMARSILSKHAVEKTLNIIRQAGSQVEYVSVDVTDSAAMLQAITAVSAKLGAVTGIIHGAGVLSDKLIEKKTEQDFNSVYATKIAGLNALLTAVPPQQLQHLVLYSSAAGFYGNVGQADYALANDILNKTAHLIHLQHPNCRVISIDWGPWDGGMVTPALKAMFAERNIHVIPIEVGTWLLASELTVENSAVIQTVVGGALAFPEEEIGGQLQTHRIHRFLSADANPFLQDHVIGGNQVLPTVNAIAWMGNLCEQLYPGYTFASCDNYQVLKGIVFDETHPASKDYILDLEETEKENGRITFKAMVSSQNEAGKPRFHYRADITLLNKLPEAPIYNNFDASENNVIEKATLYSNGTLFHGPHYQGITRVMNISPQKVTMRCELVPLSDVEQGQFPVQSFNPYIADGQFQSMVIWARQFHDAGSLPLHTVRGEQFRPIPFGITTYVSMEVKESSDSKLVADIITHDENGRIYAKVLGAEVTISKQLNHLFVPAQ